MTAAGGSVAIGVRLENWSGYTLTQVGHMNSYRLVIEWQYGAQKKRKQTS